MANSDDISSKTNQSERTDDDQTDSSLFHGNEDSALLLTSTSSKEKSPEETWLIVDNDDNNQQTNLTTDSVDDQNWKCRECGFINKYSDNICDTCETPKPIRPLLEKHLSYTKRSPSPSPSNTRSPSPEEEIIVNRTSSQSPSRGSRQSSSSPSPSRNIRRQSQSSESSTEEDDSKAENKKMSSNIYSSDHRSYEHQNDDRLHSELHSFLPSVPPEYDSHIASSGEEKGHQQYDLGGPNFMPLKDRKDADLKPSKRNQSRSPSPKEDNRSVSHYPDSDHRSTATTMKQNKSSQNPPPSKASDPENPVVVYIPDLPVNIDNNETLENMIRECLEIRHRQQIRGVKCNTQLGIGIIYLDNEEDRNRIVNIIGRAVIEPTSRTTVSFINELDLISYVVIDTKDMNNLPSTNDICRRWTELYKVSSEPQCEKLSVQFPNIFRIVTHSLDELIAAMSTEAFQINRQLASVYFRADCCFFEDLPRTTNLDRLKEAISQKISNKYMSKELIHVQYNKDGANAVVLTSGRARIWSLHTSISLDGRSFMKKDNLACRLIIRSVPKSIPPLAIQNHKMFGNSVTASLTSSSEHVIVEVSDRKIYEKCIELGALRIDEHLLSVDVYTSSSNPEDSNIDSETWYDTEMCDYKPDITPFMSNLQHPIFLLKWNSQVFLEQFNRWKSKEKSTDKLEQLCNLKRHLLRMTVMLNTIGRIKKGSYRIGEKEIKLKLDRLKTIHYDHKSKLERGRTIPPSDATKFPYLSTTVRVINEDCLIVYKNLVSQGYKPVILNMANATSPGGGYKRGDGAQEETLFRRSNYYQSLDMTLDDGKPTSRFYCNSNCELVPFAGRDQLYPMEEFGAIYTSGLIVFRQPEETGYTFMDIPMYDVCAIAMAAYRNPKLVNKNHLDSKHSIGTRKKIENIFAIAHQHKHDCLVLSALGCGAFRNPPEHVATIFKSVIEQYAGYFKCIYFAIIDDHNAGHDLNPSGNYQPFQKILGNLDIRPNREKLPDMMIGPWRILNQIQNKEIKLSDIRICYLTPCQYGGKCEEIKNERHCQEYSHPPLCPHASNTTSCKEKNDDQHMLWFRHRQKCSHGGECKLIENDPIHSNEFEHPEFCRDAGRCENMDHQHLKSYRHVPLCRYRRECVDYNGRALDHCEKFRHVMLICRFGHYCVRFHDEKHFKQEKHPFQTPCPFTPFHCRDYITLSEANNTKTLPVNVRNHCLKYSHVCRYGRQCHEKSDIHWQNTIHIARQACSHGERCTKLNQEDHLNSFSHPNIADIRRLCEYHGSQCRDRRKLEHMLHYRHDGNHDFTGVISGFGLNRKTNFVKNQANIIQTIKDYSKNLKHTLSISSEVQQFVKSLQPIHRCGKVIFESILVHGHVMSSEHMEHLKKPQFVTQAVQGHKRVRAIFDRHKIQANVAYDKIGVIEEHAKEYIHAIVSLEYSKKYDGGSTYERDFRNPSTPRTPSSHHEHDNIISVKERILGSILQPDEVDTIRKCAISIAEASWNLHNTPTGIKYQPDKSLGTDKHVFGIFGPHLGHYYGDIFLVFKSEVMLHPDANFTPQAATSFASQNTFKYRPWVRNPGSDAERIKCFHESKLHCSVPGYDYAAAAELMAITGLHKKTMDGGIKSILNRWTHVDSHEVFEAHLPRLVPLDYIEEIYIPKNLFAALTPAAQVSAKKIFGESLHITHHEINLSGMSDGVRTDFDQSRSNYQSFVIGKLIEKVKNRLERIRRLHGILVTLSPSNFTDYIVLPLRIHDAYNQYHQIEKRNSDDVYIYWQALYGDMMIALSDEQINPNKKQSHIQCLSCYIAERPSKTTSNYHESPSYIYAGDPYRNAGLKINSQQSGNCQTFHRGCNTEDFLTYCLKLEKNTGQVTLSHAGSNSIYCYETISDHFSKTTLNLNKLNYIHVSAGSQKVPIRNLVISFEQIADLHPSFDKNFKRGDDAFPQSKKSDSKKPASEEKSPSLGRKFINAVGDFFGYDGGDKKLEPCPYSVNCRLQESSEHMKEKSHPCQYSELCRNKDKEPYLTHELHRVEQCTSKSSCKKLDDPIHRAKYRHPDYPDFLIPCRDKADCRDKTSSHRIKYSHGEQIQITKDTTHGASHTASSSSKPSSGSQEKVSNETRKTDQRTSCQYGSECRDLGDSHHCSQYSHPSRDYEPKSSASSNSDRTPCRHGYGCRDQHDNHHCSQYSHPRDCELKSSASSNSDRTPCRHGYGCRDQGDSHHCSQYSHPRDHESKSSASSNDGRTPCRHGYGCRDQGDSHHCSQYSHPRDHESKSSANSNDDRTPCRHGYGCRDQGDSQHCSQYSHPSRTHGTRFSAGSNDDRTPCRHGYGCRDKNNALHSLTYSHPDDQRSRDNKIQCKHGRACYNTDPYHRSTYSHPHK